MRFLFLLFTLLFLFSPAQARTVDCLLAVNGTRFIDGPCNMNMFDHSGSFELRRMDGAYFAYVEVDGFHSGNGYWNATDHGRHAHDPLGPLNASGACWTNKNARVCAWKLGEPRSFADSDQQPSFRPQHGIEREVQVRPNKEITLQAFFNCNGPINAAAFADRGFIRQRWSSRFQCGNPDQPALEFVYLSPRNSNDDFVHYSEGSGSGFVEHLTFSDDAPTDDAPAPVRVNGSDETSLWSFWDCENQPVQMTVSAGSGFTVVRDNIEAVCGEQAHPVKEVFYRSAKAFVGSDSVTIKSSTAAPLTIPIIVSTAP